MLHHSAFPFWEGAPGGRLIRPARAPCQLTPQPPPPRPPGRLPPPSRPLHRRQQHPAAPHDRPGPQQHRPRPSFVAHAQQHRGPPASTHAAIPAHHPAIPCPQRQRVCAPAPSIILPPPTRCPAPPSSSTGSLGRAAHATSHRVDGHLRVQHGRAAPRARHGGGGSRTRGISGTRCTGP